MSRGFVAFLVLLAIGAFFVVWDLNRPSCVISNEHAAISTLKTVAVSQSIMVEREPERGGGRYASIAELGSWGIVDSLVGAGTKQGYSFVGAPSTTAPRERWWAVARPLADRNDYRILFVNQKGEIFTLPYSPENLAKTCDPDTCEVPSEATPLSRKRPGEP